jgi:SET domain-containing protein
MYPDSYGSNPYFPSNDDFEVVHRDNQSGLGVITHRSFKKGEMVAMFSGDLFDEITQHTLQVEPGVHLYDAYFVGFFLHSCSPNVHLDMKNRKVIAVRNIKADEHLLMDYAQTEDVLYRQFPCSCGSAQCRGWITGRKEAIDENHPLYLDFVGKQVEAV